MGVSQAYKMCVGLFKQDSSTGTAYTNLVDTDYAAIKWATTSVIPTTYEFTNIQRAGTTVETTEKALITDVTKFVKYASGKVTPGTVTFATMTQADVASILSTLRTLDADDPYLCLLLVGILKTDAATRVYDVFYAAAGIITNDGETTAEAKENFTGSLEFQPSGFPTDGITANGATMSWVTSTNVITFAMNQ